MKRSVLLFLCCLTGFTASAQPILTLEEAIRRGLATQEEVLIARNEVQAAETLNHPSIAGAGPTVSAGASASEGYSLANNDRGGNAAAVSGDLTGSIPIFTGYRIRAARGRLAELEQRSRTLLEVQIANTIADIALSYFDLVRQQSYIRTLQQTLEVSAQRLNILQTRQLAGLANNADIFQAQIDVNDARQGLQSQELVTRQAMARLADIIGASPDTIIVVQDTIIIDPTLQWEALQAALGANPELLAAQQQAQVARFAEREVAANRYPTVDASAGIATGYSNNTGGSFGTLGPTVGLSVSVPIFSGTANRRRRIVAGIDVENAELDRSIIERNLQLGAYNAWQAYRTALEQLTLEQQNNALSRDLLQLTQQRFAVRQATIIDVREAQRSFVESGTRLVNLSYSAKAAEIELKRLSNTLRPD